MKTLSILATLGLLALTLVGFGSDLWWGFAMVEHLRLYLAWASGFVILFAWREQVLLGILLVLILINASVGLSLYQGESATQEAELTITHVALNKDNWTPLDTILAQGSDIVFLQEVTPPLADALPEAMPNYEVILTNPLWNTHGTGMLVREDWRGEVLSAEITNIPSTSDRPLLAATIELDGQEMQLLSLHVTRPKNRGTVLGQQSEIAGVAKWSQERQSADLPVIIIGDMNLTAWSSLFERLLETGHLENGQNPYGLKGTWPARLPSFWRLPIDHIVHSPDIQVASYEVGQSVNSDHLPLHIGLYVRENQ